MSLPPLHPPLPSAARPALGDLSGRLFAARPPHLWGEPGFDALRLETWRDRLAEIPPRPWRYQPQPVAVAALPDARKLALRAAWQAGDAEADPEGEAPLAAGYAGEGLAPERLFSPVVREPVAGDVLTLRGAGGRALAELEVPSFGPFLGARALMGGRAGPLLLVIRGGGGRMAEACA